MGTGGSTHAKTGKYAMDCLRIRTAGVSAAGLNDTKVYIYTYIAISGSLLYCTKETYICSINKNAEDFAQKSKP